LPSRIANRACPPHPKKRLGGPTVTTTQSSSPSRLPHCSERDRICTATLPGCRRAEVGCAARLLEVNAPSEAVPQRGDLRFASGVEAGAGESEGSEDRDGGAERLVGSVAEAECSEHKHDGRSEAQEDRDAKAVECGPVHAQAAPDVGAGCALMFAAGLVACRGRPSRLDPTRRLNETQAIDDLARERAPEAALVLGGEVRDEVATRSGTGEDHGLG